MGGLHHEYLQPDSRGLVDGIEVKPDVVYTTGGGTHDRIEALVLRIRTVQNPAKPWGLMTALSPERLIVTSASVVM